MSGLVKGGPGQLLAGSSAIEHVTVHGYGGGGGYDTVRSSQRYSPYDRPGGRGGGGGGGGGGDDRRPARPPRVHETEAFSLVTENVFFQLLALLAECLQTVSGGPGTLSGIQGEFRTADVGRIRNDISNEVHNRHHRPAREVARSRFQLRLADACTVRGAISEDTITFLAFMFFAWLLSQRRSSP